jgi:hypothetical protein
LRPAIATRTDARAGRTLLPLATGVLLIGINSVVPSGGGVLLGLMVLLTLGAVLPLRPWRTGAIAAAPIVVAAVATSAGDSLGDAGLLLLASPVVVAVFAAAVKGGAMMAAPAIQSKAGAGL